MQKDTFIEVACTKVLRRYEMSLMSCFVRIVIETPLVLLRSIARDIFGFILPGACEIDFLVFFLHIYQDIVWTLDGPIRANRFADSRESPDSRESFQGPRTEPLFCESRFGGLKVANRRFEAIRANRSHVMKIGLCCESIRANRSTRIARIRVANRRAI